MTFCFVWDQRLNSKRPGTRALAAYKKKEWTDTRRPFRSDRRAWEREVRQSCHWVRDTCEKAIRFCLIRCLLIGINEGCCSQTIHLWYISLHLPEKSTKCR